MFIRVFLALILIVAQQDALGRRLGCYICYNLREYSYVITAETVPYNLIEGCAFTMSQDSCAMKLEIDLDKQQTIINVTASSTTYVETSVIANVTIENGLKRKRYVTFWCSDVHGGCNDEKYLKRVLESLTLEGSFQELEPLLIRNNQTFDNSSCLTFSNKTTTKCRSDCNDDTESCYINSITEFEQSSDVCAECSPISDYYLKYSMTFLLENLTLSDTDSRQLSCAVPHCNSIANLERIGELMTISFNATTFFDDTTTTIGPQTTTSTVSGASFFSRNHFLIFHSIIFLFYFI